MLIAIVLDRPLQEAQSLVDQPHQFLQEIKQVLDDKKSHPILERMLRTIQGDIAKQEATSVKSARTTLMTWMITNTNKWKPPGGAPGWLSAQHTPSFGVIRDLVELPSVMTPLRSVTLSAENSNPSWFKNPFYVNPRTYT